MRVGLSLLGLTYYMECTHFLECFSISEIQRFEGLNPTRRASICLFRTRFRRENQNHQDRAVAENPGEMAWYRRVTCLSHNYINPVLRTGDSLVSVATLKVGGAGCVWCGEVCVVW